MSYIYHVFKEYFYKFIESWWWGSDPNVKSTVSGMSLRDVYNVQKSWSVIHGQAYQNGFLIFISLFRADPPSQKFFKYIADASEDELASSILFRAHIVNIMSSINDTVENLRQPEIVAALMEKLGESHNAKGLQHRHFLLFRDVLLKILAQDLEFEDDVLASWALFIDFINRHILSKIPN